MKSIKHFLSFICLIALFSFNEQKKSSECEIEAFYKGSSPSNGSLVLTSKGEVEGVEMILTPIELEIGKYVVNVTKKSSNLYKIDNKNVYIRTKYCFEYAYSKEVILRVESTYGFTKGKILF